MGRGSSAQLMLGCVALAVDDTLTVNREEMEDCRWFTREEVIAGLANAGWGESERLRVPGPYAIAHHLIRAFADDTLESDGRSKI